MSRNLLSKILLIIFLCLGGLFFVWGDLARATNQGDVVINELMWMGSSASIADEWIELRNTTGTEIDLSGWTVEGAATSGGTLTIPNGKTISANGYFLIANYNEEDARSVLNVTSDWVTASVSLKNTAAQYILKDNTGATIDTADDGVGDPPAGDNTNKYSMERNGSPGNGTLAENWHTATSSQRI